MATKVAISKLNASTLDILNTIRANASQEYQSLVPEISKTDDIPAVGEILMGYPALANQFISSLVNRIALVNIKSALFNNAYAELKKGYLEFGETVEEAFVNIAKAREFSVEKAPAREFKRTIPDVRTAFHAMNWRVQYPVTIQDEELRMAFMSAQGVQDLIARIVNSVYTGAEYDEFLLFKYLMIKAIAHGKMHPVGIDGSDIKDGAKKFRSLSNKLTFMSNEYNAAGVTTVTNKSEQQIFMSSDFNAEFDVDVLAGAFNMDKAEFIGQLRLIDDWGTFDNDRFSEIFDNTTMIEPVTADELAICSKVKAVLVDREWFQIYDNQIKFTEQYVASGEYWNYFLNVWKTVSSSPFSNAVVFVDDTQSVERPLTLTARVTDKIDTENSTIFTVEIDDVNGVNGGNVEFITTEDDVENLVAVHKYGSYIIPKGDENTTYTYINVKCGGVLYNNTDLPLYDEVVVGSQYTLTQPDLIATITPNEYSGGRQNLANTAVFETNISGVTDADYASMFHCLPEGKVVVNVAHSDTKKVHFVVPSSVPAGAFDAVIMFAPEGYVPAELNLSITG